MNLTLKNSATPLIGILAVAYISLGISGGPNYGGSKKFINILGAYAGTLDPVLVGSNSLGIFTLKIPQVGLSTGDFSVFTNGRTFVGTIQGIANPNKRSLTAQLQAIPVVTGNGETVTTLNYHTDGTLHAHVKAGSNGAVGVSSIRLKGTALTTTTINSNPATAVDVDYVVNGFKQSN